MHANIIDTLTPATASCIPHLYWLVLKDPYFMFDSQLSAMAIPGQNKGVCVCVCVCARVRACVCVYILSFLFQFYSL